MVCPLCGSRKARRACPAVAQQICPVCCGTKRLVQINCPSDCVYLASARDHPPAVTVRQQQRDMGFMGHFLRDLSERQAELLLMTSAAIERHQPAVLQALVDDDVAEAVTALASTFETAERGVIYEHRPASLPSERLVAALKLVFVEAATASSAGFGRDAASVLRRIADAVQELHDAEPGNHRAFLDLLGRMIRKNDAGEGSGAPAAGEGQRLIVL